MKILVLSDSHGCAEAIEAAFRQAEPFDSAFFLGDGEREFLRRAASCTAKIYCVKGNCDWNDRLKLSLIAEVGGHSFLLCHGHSFGVKSGLERLYYAAAVNDCEAVLFGHTHCRELEQDDGVILFNPGSAALPRDGLAPSAGIITDEDGVLAFKHIDLTY